MGSIENRLRHLEARTDATRVDEAAATSRKVLARMTVEELRAYVAALRRMKAGEDPGAEDEAILRRVEELREEVRNGL